MRLFALVIIAVLSLTTSSCNRGPDSVVEEKNAGKEVATKVKAKKEIDIFEVTDFGEEAIKRVEEKVKLTDEQKTAIQKMSLEYDFAGAEAKELEEMAKKFMARIRKEVVTKEQFEQGRKKN